MAVVSPNITHHQWRMRLILVARVVMLDTMDVVNFHV
jgi:hypothetical protein